MKKNQDIIVLVATFTSLLFFQTKVHSKENGTFSDATIVQAQPYNNSDTPPLINQKEKVTDQHLQSNDVQGQKIEAKPDKEKRDEVDSSRRSIIVVIYIIIIAMIFYNFFFPPRTFEKR